MGVLVSWAATEGLNLGARLLGNMLGKANFDTIISEKLDFIDQKLDLLLAAPYKQALMHFMEGNVEKTKEKLIEAVSLNEFDLPALAMYAYLLCYVGQSELAIEYFERLLRQFGPHSGIVPIEIIAAYSAYMTDGAPLKSISPFRIETPSNAWACYPTEVRCSLSCIIVTWRPPPGTLGGGALSSFPVGPTIVMYDWRGNTLLRLDLMASDVGIIACTDQYFTLSLTTGMLLLKTEVQIFRTRDGSRARTLKPLPSPNIAQLFCSDGDAVVTSAREYISTSQRGFGYKPPTFHFQFAGAIIRSSLAEFGGALDISPAA